MKRHQITIKDLAKQLNIAPSTVSRALKDHPNISSETKQKVLKLAKALKYEPNQIALSLKNSSTKTIGVIIPEIIHFFFSTVISGIEEVAYSNGYTVMFCQSNESFEKEKLDTQALLSHRVDGFLISHSRNTTHFNHFEEIIARDIPLVFFDRAPIGLQVPKIIIDDFDAAKEATQHLINQGCKRILHLQGSHELEICKNRKEGYKAALRTNGIEIDKELIIQCGSGTRQIGYRKTKIALESNLEFDGVFCNNDILALGAMSAIKEKALDIPRDIAVVGFGNWQFSALTEPQLSSVLQPGLEMGRKAMHTLLDILNEKIESNAALTKTLQTRLVIRDSSSKIRQKDYAYDLS